MIKAQEASHGVGGQNEEVAGDHAHSSDTRSHASKLVSAMYSVQEKRRVGHTFPSKCVPHASSISRSSQAALSKLPWEGRHIPPAGRFNTPVRLTVRWSLGRINAQSGGVVRWSAKSFHREQSEIGNRRELHRWWAGQRNLMGICAFRPSRAWEAFLSSGTPLASD
jgi:hypothetical protein